MVLALPRLGYRGRSTARSLNPKLQEWLVMNTRPIWVLCTLCASVGTACADGPNQEELQAMEIEPPDPILEGYTADPHALVIGDTTYVYPTSDKPGWQTT